MKTILILFIFLNLISVAQAQETEFESIKSMAEVKEIIEDFHNHPFYGNSFGKLLHSKTVVERETRIHPDSAEAWYFLGFIIRHEFSRSEAEVAFKKAIELKPDYAEAYHELGMYYQFPSGCGNSYLDRSKQERDSFYEKAIRAHLTAIEFKPDFAEAYLALGDTYYKVANYEDAVRAYVRAIELDTDSPEQYLGLSKTYEQLKRYDAAINIAKQHILVTSNFLSNLSKSDLKETVWMYSTYESYERIGTLYNKLGRPQEALATFNKMVELNIDHPNIHLQLGLIYCTLGDKQSAIAEHEVLVNFWKKVGDVTLQSLTQRYADELIEKIRNK